MIAVYFVIDQPREVAPVDIAFHTLAAFIDGRNIVVLLQIGYGIQDFVIKTVAEALLLVVVPISLGQEFGLGPRSNNSRKSRIIHDTCLMGSAPSSDRAPMSLPFIVIIDSKL